MNEDPEVSLSHFPLFEGFGPDQLRLMVERGQPRGVAAGEVLFCEGDPADAVYLVLEGRFEVFAAEGRARTRTVSVVGPGQVLGEVAVLHRIPRSAGVRAGEASKVLRWEATSFRRLLGEFPVLSTRVRGEGSPGVRP